MAELYPIANINQSSICIPEPAGATPEMLPQPAGAGPLWRSLLFPLPGQRAVEFGRNGSDLFGFLRTAGVRFERETGHPEPVGAADFDLILEDRTKGRAPVRPDQIHSLLVPGGRWVVALEEKRWVGLAGLRILRRARREGFETIETFYAHPSLRSPRMLVPLDYPEPFKYFLLLAIGIHTPRQRLLALAARWLCAMRLHRMLLPNLIVVARRKR
jgi:hypothetical protein